jgi:hypothetical protein
MKYVSEQECPDKSICESVSVVNVFLESQMTLNEGEDFNIGSENENEKYEICQVLKLSGCCSSFSWMKSGECLKIDHPVEIISGMDFQSCSSLNEVILSSNSHLRTIRVFQKCTSLCLIEIPPSVEFIGDLKKTDFNRYFSDECWSNSPSITILSFFNFIFHGDLNQSCSYSGHEVVIH